MGYERIRLRPISGSLGAIVEGVDLRAYSPELHAEVRRALLEYLVLFFPEQQISPAEQVAFGRHFGDLHVHPFIPSLPEHPEVIRLRASSGAHEMLRLSNAWHEDLSYTSDPPLAGILRAVRIPPRGGDTMWVNLYKAFDTLSAKMQSILAEMSAWHDVTKTFRREDLQREGGAAQYWEVFRKTPPTLQPLVQVHPETGRRLLYVSELTTTHIEGLSQTESDALLGFLFRHIDWKELHCRFSWSRDTVAIWDNRCTAHYAVRDYEEPREMHRVTVIGERFS